MRTDVFYTPPLWRADASNPAPVRRRHVLYIPGYDNEAKTRSRSLFVRELVRYGRRFGLKERTVTPVQHLPEIPGLRWTVRAGRDDWTTDTTYDVLRWDDIVERDFNRSMPFALGRLLVGTADSIVTGLVVRLYRLNWIFASVGIYPITMVLLLALAACGLGYATWRVLVEAAGLPTLVSLFGGAAVAAGVVALAYPYFTRWYVWHLMHDWLFNWAHGNGWRSDYMARVERFADHLRSVMANSDADEVLIIGHSSGACMAVETVALALEADPKLGRRGPELALLTIGTSLPASALGSRAKAIHRRLARVMTAPEVGWVEYQAPQDWLNGSGFNPIRRLPLEIDESACANPLIRSPRFKEITSDAVYKAMVRSPFRMHFQFMMANDKPGEYDFIMMVVGPMRLSWRVRHPEEAKRLVGAPTPPSVEAAVPA